MNFNNLNPTEKDLILQAAKQIIALEMEIKAIKNDIKEVKKEAKEEGIQIKAITAVINEFKKEFKKDETERTVEVVIRKILEDDQEVLNSIETLVQKD